VRGTFPFVIIAAGLWVLAWAERSRALAVIAAVYTAAALLHQRHRLGILTITAEAQRAEFGYLREALSLTPGNLSKHLTVLEQAGMIEVEDVRKGLRARGCHATWSVAGRR
jgi:DNA-binding MarR family transcriptional regulator